MAQQRANEIKVSTNFGLKIARSTKQMENNLIEHTFTFCPDEGARKAAEEPAIKLEWEFPYIDTAFMWHPCCGTDRRMHVDWEYPLKTMTSISAPMVSLFSEDSKNRYTFALSEVKETVSIMCGVREEDGMVLCSLSIPMKDFVMEKDYTVKLVEDQRDIPYYQSIQAMTDWWEKDCGIVPMQVPEEARLPVYSSWYSYHQNLFDHEIEEECRLASAMGFRSIIVDDGWQTMDNNRGYSFCGDWEVAKPRFPDFAAHVKRVHEMGMKYLIWYSVPYVGKKSKVWDRFKDKLLTYDERQQAGILDPRYPEVREFLIGCYEHAVRDWDLDGLKLDFIDSIYFRPESKAFDEGMDFSNVQEALDCMMTTITERLTALKPNVMIEFRQRYIGPNMRKYGNMFRVGDCPTSGITNRVGMVDLRLLSGSTAVHSDMLMWHRDEPAEIAALQIIDCIFATVQISMKLGDIPKEQVEMLNFWVAFMKEHREMLLEQPIIPLEPQHLYPVVQVKKGSASILACYSENHVITLDGDLDEIILLNGTKSEDMLLRTESERSWNLVQKDCYGKILRQETIVLHKGIHVLPVTTGGLIELKG